MCDCYFQTCLQAPLTLDYHLQQQPILHASHLGLVPKQFLCLHCGHVGLEPPFRQPLPVSPGFWSSPASSDPVVSIHLLIRNPASWDSPQILSGRLLCNTVTLLCCRPCISSCGGCTFICVFEVLVGTSFLFQIHYLLSSQSKWFPSNNSSLVFMQ